VNARAIHALLCARALEAPDAAAVLAPARAPLTYRRLLLQVETTAQALAEMGLGRSARIATLLPNGPEAAVSFLAIASSATIAPLNPTSPAGEFDRILPKLGISALVLREGTDSPAVGVAHDHGIPVIRLTPQLEAEAGVFTLTGPSGSTVDPTGLA